MTTTRVDLERRLHPDAIDLAGDRDSLVCLSFRLDDARERHKSLLVSTSMRRPPTSGSLKRRLHLRGNAGVIDRLADRLAAGGDEHAEGDHESERENDRAIGATSVYQLPSGNIRCKLNADRVISGVDHHTSAVTARPALLRRKAQRLRLRSYRSFV